MTQKQVKKILGDPNLILRREHYDKQHGAGYFYVYDDIVVQFGWKRSPRRNGNNYYSIPPLDKSGFAKTSEYHKALWLHDRGLQYGDSPEKVAELYGDPIEVVEEEIDNRDTEGWLNGTPLHYWKRSETYQDFQINFIKEKPKAKYRLWWYKDNSQE